MPAVIREVSEAQRKESMRILTTAERKAAPTAAEKARRAAEAKAAIAQREFEKKVEAAQQKGRQIDIALGRLEQTRGPVAPTTAQQSIFVRGGPAITQATSNRYQQRALSSIVQNANLQGITAAKDVQLSGLSQAAYNYTKKFAKTTRKGAPILQEKISVVSPTTGKVLRYPIESVVRGAEMAGMIPGGIEVMARRPGVIVPALVVGARQATVGTAEAAITDPKQFVSDIATLGLLFKGPGALKTTVKVAKPVTTRAYAQSVKLMVDDFGTLGYRPTTTFKAPPKTAFNNVFKAAIENAQKQAKRDLTATEKANIRASIKRSRQAELEAIAEATSKTRARKENTLAKDIAKQFEKERIAKETKPPKSKPAEAKQQAKYERAKVIDITRKTQNLIEKASRLQAKFESGTISKSVYDRQKASILKQVKEIDDLRKGAIEVNKKASKQPDTQQFTYIKPTSRPAAIAKAKTTAKTKAKQFEQITPASKQVTSVFTKVKPIAKVGLSATAFVAAMTRTNTLAKAYEATAVKTIPKPKPFPKAKPAVKTAVGVKDGKRRVTPSKKPPVTKKKPTPKISKPGNKMPMPEIPKYRRVEKKKTAKVKRIVTKEYTNFQIVNQMAGINQLFG